MCTTCGCSEGAKATIAKIGERGHEHHHDDHNHDHHHHHHDNDHDNDHGHSHYHQNEHEHVHADGTRHSHAHGQHQHRHQESETVALETRILAKNDALAARNRAWLAGREVLALNLVSSPGSGKTTLLERTIRDLSGQRDLFVIEGDQATANDGERIRAAGAPAVQVNTGTGCHLEADMIVRALSELKPGVGSLLFIENVGNLVCPALFDLGERAKVVMFSVTEGEDKPLKYPHMFAASELVLLSKIDLRPHVDFDVDRAIGSIHQVRPGATVLQVSARTGEGMPQWYEWIEQQAQQAGELQFA